MVDVQAMNDKLIRRSEEMLLRLTARSRAEVREALERAGGSVKIAVLLLHGLEPDEAVALLRQAGGGLRDALALVGRRGSDTTQFRRMG